MPSNNTFREYKIYFPADVADLIKRQAREHQMTEAAWLKQCVAEKLFAAPVEAVVETEPLVAEMPVAA